MKFNNNYARGQKPGSYNRRCYNRNGKRCKHFKNKRYNIKYKRNTSKRHMLKQYTTNNSNHLNVDTLLWSQWILLSLI